MGSEQAFTLALIALYATLRFILGMTGRRWLALVGTALVLGLVGLALVGPVAVGVLLVCAAVDAAWIGFGSRRA